MKSIIHDYKFSKDGIEEIKSLAQGENWPVVYIINNDKEAYVGETINAYHRAKQHIENPERRKLTNIHVITNNDFNKSATLDVESSLIQLMEGDKKFDLQNGNAGVSSHHYSNMTEFRTDSETFRLLWDKLKKKQLADNEIETILNSDLFKFSPYKSLNYDQCAARDFILGDIADAFENDKKVTTFVNGAAGTGKTILAIYLAKLLVDNNDLDVSDEDQVSPYVLDLKRIHDKRGKLEIGYVVAMTSLRETIGNVFKKVKGLSKSMVIAPSEVSKKHYDILLVDEAHRLKRPQGLGADIGSFYETNRKLGFKEKEGTQLDWIIKQSDVQILFYDSSQTIKAADVRESDFDALLSTNTSTYQLESQMRCIGGNDYLTYLKDIFNNRNPIYTDFSKKEAKYEFKLFDDVSELVKEIKEKNDEYDLCRTVAGYAWEWNTKDTSIDAIEKNNLYDIDIEGNHYYWNTTNIDWVNSPNAINEIGCIHTVQGYDLNYCGVIIGNELIYNKEKQRIELDKSQYFDKKAYEGCSDEEISNNVKNIYVTLCTRGIKGTFVYVCNKNLKEYLNRFIKSKNAK